MSIAPHRWPASRGAAALLLVVCALLWSSAGLLSRLLEASGPIETTFWRSFFCALTIGLIVFLERRRHALEALTAMGWAGLASSVLWAVIFSCFMLALMLTSVANTLLMVGLSPLLSAILGRIILGERIGPTTWAVIATAGLGLWWMLKAALSGDGLTGLLVAAAVPLATSTNLVMIRRLGASFDLAPAVGTGALISSLVLLPFFAPISPPPPTKDLLILFALGAFQLALPCWLMVQAARQLKPHEISLIGLLEVVLGPLWVWLGAGEVTPLSTLQGGAVIVLALCANELLRARPVTDSGTARA